jgi:hypothetical protein
MGTSYKKAMILTVTSHYSQEGLDWSPRLSNNTMEKLNMQWCISAIIASIVMEEMLCHFLSTFRDSSGSDSNVSFMIDSTLPRDLIGERLDKLAVCIY